VDERRELTVDGLREILRRAAGEDDSGDGDFLDVPFVDLGYDSLILLEVAGQVTRDYGVALSDGALEGVETPRGFLDLVNATLASA
jgi:minimal PKS acyl carrier protein